MMPFITRRRHDAEMASRKAEIAALDSLLSDRDATIEYLEARLDALTPARGQGGRFVGKAVSNG